MVKIKRNNFFEVIKYLIPIIIFLIAVIVGIVVICVRRDMFELDANNKKNYAVKSRKEIQEQDLKVVELEHIKTKAKVLLFMCDDENRVFNIAFKTPVNDSKGKPHILEHSVLCGSRKYNVKDPFIELAKSSMNTFLNALTYDDKTCYPVASANLKDFHNLVDVYLDAVFYPNVITDERFFRQEGWHYEINDKNEPLTVNGVVYNEMRGVFSDPDSLLEYGIGKNLFPNTNYEYVSGGKPIDIMDLSYDEFVDFHKKYYSASNSRIYYYGKLDYNEEIAYLNDEYLSKQDYVEVDSEVSYVKDFVRDSEYVDEYNLETDDKDKSYIAYSFALDKKKSSLEGIALEVLDYMLFSSDGAILKEKCQNAGLGEEISTMYNQGQGVGSYIIIAKNIDSAKKDSFKNIILDSISEIIENGVDVNKVKSALNTLYFNYAEDEFGTMPKGLALSLASLDSYLYGDDYDTFLKYKDVFNILNNEDLKNKNNTFVKLLKKVFIDNNHRCINILNPSSTFVAEKEEVLKEKLEERKKQMSDEEIEDEIKKCKDLKEFQKIEDTPEKLKCIPKLDIADIERNKKFIDYKKSNIDGLDVISSSDNEKDVVYLQLYYDVSNYSKEELYLLSLMTSLILKINLKDEDYHKFNEYIDMNTGGFAPRIVITDKKTFFEYELKVAESNLDKAFIIFKKAIENVTFDDEDRISIVINECKARAFSTLLNNGHTAAMQRANVDFYYPSYVYDKVDSGAVGFNLFLNALSKVYDDNSATINEVLNNLYKKTILQKPTFCYCASRLYEVNVERHLKEFYNNMTSYINNINDKSDITVKINSGIEETKKYINYDDFDKKVKKEAIITPNEINFCGLAGKFNEDEYIGRLKLLKILFGYEYLWTNIRVLGGAYGCMFNPYKTGSYVFASYRDPNLSDTNKVFLDVKNYLKDFDKSDEDIKKYIIATMGTIDNPLTTVLKFRRNVSAYLNDNDDEKMNEERHSILDTKASDIRDLYKIFDDIDTESSMCALITASKALEARKEYDNVWKITN